MTDVSIGAGPTRAGVVAVIGAPNVGKSTLVNALVGQKVAIVSSKVQTTRARLMGIAVHDRTQLMLVDTPGIFAPRTRLDRAMVAAAWEGAGDGDVTLVLVDARGAREDAAAVLAALGERPGPPPWLVLNKVDIADKQALLGVIAELTAGDRFARTFIVSALNGSGVADLKTALADSAPEGPWLYPADQLTDASSRLLASELTREQLYLQLHDELPYSAAVDTERWEDRRDGSVMIHQQILIERDSQKGIVLGKGGARLKAIGEAARAGIADALGRKVHLFLHVKVQPNWSEDRALYRELGLGWVE